MNKSLHPIIIFFWGYILFVRVQCQDTLGVLNESKLSEHKELCFRRCDIGFQVDDKETSSEEIFRRRSCYKRCLRGDGEMKSVKTKRRVFVHEQKSSLIKRIRRDGTDMVDNPNSGMKYGFDNCAPGNGDSGTLDRFPAELRIVFHELEDERKGRYEAIVTWKALPNESGNWTGYKIYTIYSPPPDNKFEIECNVVPKNVTRYNINNSTKGIINYTWLYVTVVSSPHSVNLDNSTGTNERNCIVPKPCGTGSQTVVTTSSSTVEGRKAKSTSVVTTSFSTVEGRKAKSTSEPFKEAIPISDNRTITILMAVFVPSCVFALAFFLGFMYYRRSKYYNK